MNDDLEPIKMIAIDYDRLTSLEQEIAENRTRRREAQDNAGVRDRMRSSAARRGYEIALHPSAIQSGLKSYQCLNPDCMAVFFSRAAESECRACAAQGMQYAVVAGTVNSTPCDAACTSATGPECHCACGGANHGDKWSVGFTFPRNVEAHRRELRERRRLNAGIRATYDTEEFNEKLAEADRLRAYFEDSLACAIEADNERAAVFLDDLISGPKPETNRTKAKTIAADQFYDLRVLNVKVREGFGYGASYGEPPPQICIVGAASDGETFWLHLDNYAFMRRCFRFEKTNGHHCDSNCDVPEIEVGEVIRVKARIKSRGNMTFLSHAKVIAHVNPFGWILSDAPTPETTT